MMSIDFSKVSCMGTESSAGAGSEGKASLGLRHTLRREIPACYADESEHFALEASGWTNYGWDVSSEDERAFARGEIPSTAFVPFSCVAQSEPEMETNEGRENISTVRAASIYQDSLLADMLVDPIEVHPLKQQGGTSPLPQPLPENEYPYMSLSDSTVDSLKYLEALYSYSGSAVHSFPPPPTVPQTPAISHTALPCTSVSTPALSPSMSSSSEDSDWECTPPITTPYSLQQFISANSEAKAIANYDAQFFAQPFQDGRPLPTMFFPSASTSYQTTALQNLAVDPASFCAFPTSMHSTDTQDEICPPPCMPSMSIPVSGPSRATRAEHQSKPYARKSKDAKAKKTVTGTPKPGPSPGELACSTCNYVQARGPGDQRSFKRHLEKHQPKSKWRCRGIPQSDGTYHGGCDKLFARKDALQRHIKTAQTDCVSDFKPCEDLQDSLDFSY